MMLSLLLALAGAGGNLPGSPIMVVEDAAHGVVCYYIPYDVRLVNAQNGQPALSCVKL